MVHAVVNLHFRAERADLFVHRFGEKGIAVDGGEEERALRSGEVSGRVGGSWIWGWGWGWRLVLVLVPVVVAALVLVLVLVEG